MKKILFAALYLALVAGSCSPATSSNAITFPKIDRHPEAIRFDHVALMELPVYNLQGSNEENLQTPNLRGYDLSSLDLSDDLEYLLFANFDDQTIWPECSKMPTGFDLQRIMEYGKNPGLGVRALHEMGYTGKNVGIAIIDTKLLVDHQEYVDQLQLYEEMDDILGGRSEMHGTAVASIAVGKSVGVAPEADLYYIATHMGSGKDLTYLAKAITRILEVNAQLPYEKKIRVITMQIGWKEDDKGYEPLMDAIERATSENILVISSNLRFYTPFRFHGLGRNPLDDPDDSGVYLPGFFAARYFYSGEFLSDSLMVPMDSRAVASPNGINEYAFFFQGGWSWAMPYLAGVYALAVQADPEITPNRFWEIAMKMGRTNQIELNEKSYSLGPIIDPIAIIMELKK